MKIRRLRQITCDENHNAFTGACWFKDALYVAYRQGDSHTAPNGKLIVMRSRDEGVSFETVAVFRGQYDTRDAHLHTDGERLFLNGVEKNVAAPHSPEAANVLSGAAWTENGFNWSNWTRATGADGYVLWRPETFDGKHYCAGFTLMKDGQPQQQWFRVAWFQSDDGLNWELLRVLREGADQPNECSFDFQSDGAVTLLMRREDQARKPLLLRSQPPYEEWRATELDIPLHGLALWFAGDQLWISGRWFVSGYAAHVGVFQIVDDQAVLKTVLPSGSGWDCGYMGIARHPNSHRFFLSYYSDHNASANPAVSQWTHPDIYLADVTFAIQFIPDWRVSPFGADASLAEAQCPTDETVEGWTSSAHAQEEEGESEGFVSVASNIEGRAGVIYLSSDLEVGPCDSGLLHLGYDGPIKVWLNGELVLEASGSNPAIPDTDSLAVRFRHGTNRLIVALDSNQGRAEGIYARYEKSDNSNGKLN